MDFDVGDIIDTYRNGTEKTIRTAGVDISLTECVPDDEVNTTILAIPGGPGLPKGHLAPLTMLVEQGCRVISYDTHNVGKSSNHPEPHRLETFREVLTGVASEYSNVTLAGHSWGAMLALDLVCNNQHPDTVNGLIALAPLFDTQENIQIAKTLCSTYLDVQDMEYMAQVEADESYENDEKYAELAEEIDDEFGFIPPIPDFVIEQAYERFNEEMYNKMWGPQEFVLNEDGVLRDWSVKHKLGNISIPTLLLTGKKDMFGYHDLFEAQRKIPSPTTVGVIPETSHSFFWEQPSESITRVAQWMETVEID